MSKSWMRVLFVVAAVYDAVLGLAFMIAPAGIYDLFNVTPPNHFGYVHFPALLLIVFAAMFATVAANPIRHRILIPFGIGLKIAYSGTVFFYSATSGIPSMWLPWAWCDLVFLVLFAAAWWTTGGGRAEGAANT